MAWYMRAPTPEKKAVDEATEKLARARAAKRTILERVINKLEKLPIDEALEALGKDIGGRRT